ncbi:carbon-nitrogen hydrolase family protein [Conexibacter sp. W3-3-2]|uniref:carbon-nitrogen hydrolase family protein n=1 Tax=Conexibacter sp. W3-3-2 TaxID=2675227 RepID=UPI0012BA2CEF|nr:carbon-nitrogen hydrolase family protein [Conexibacter sp. W3-3-2]MTD44190.1 carbon-nitrogen hydrolase family protein [Conexibacter sp. W3-3-2]
MRAAVIQLTSTTDVARNVAAADRHVRAAAADGAQLVLLPEKWTAYGPAREVAALAQPLDGEAVAWARATARELGIDLVAGSMAEAPAADDADARTRNTSVHVGPEGELRATYRKIHPFDVDVDGTSYRESEHERPGDEAVLTTAADGTGLGMSVCYDLRFPELYRVLTLRGARILLVPSAFTLATTREHWEPLLRARAIENQCFVLAANQVGEHAPGLRTGGRSTIVDPWGVVLAQQPDREGHVLADLDLDGQDRIRRDLPVLHHRRPHAYAWPT